MPFTDPILFTNLPDAGDRAAPHGARCEVGMPLRVLRKIAAKHASDPEEPWGQWLSREAVGALHRLAQSDRLPVAADLARDAGLAEAVDHLGRAIRAALGRPLALLYKVEYPDGRRMPGEKWQLVLPSGAVAFIYCGQGRKELKTCYYLDERDYEEQKPTRRWKRTVRVIVGRHARLAGGRFVLPDPRDRFAHRDERGDTKENWFRRRFVTPAAWGFDDAGGQPVYAGKLGTWNAAPAPGPTGGLRMGPRVRWDDATADEEVGNG